MIPVPHPTNNIRLGPPSNMTRAECGSLEATYVEDRNYNPPRGTFFSWWRFTPAEIDVLAKGGAVRLAVHGPAHPPVWLDVEAIPGPPPMEEPAASGPFRPIDTTGG